MAGSGARRRIGAGHERGLKQAARWVERVLQHDIFPQYGHRDAAIRQIRRD